MLIPFSQESETSPEHETNRTLQNIFFFIKNHVLSVPQTPIL